MISNKYNNKLAVAVDKQWKKDIGLLDLKNINQDLESLKINKKIRLLKSEEN